jgi:YD repeat-containing protein
MNIGRLCIAVAIFIPSAATASETIHYGYDELGRVKTVTHSGTVNNGLQAAYQYDAADNRLNVTVTGASSNSPPSHGVIVVPLNGFTVIPIG